MKKEYDPLYHLEQNKFAKNIKKKCLMIQFITKKNSDLKKVQIQPILLGITKLTHLNTHICRHRQYVTCRV